MTIKSYKEDNRPSQQWFWDDWFAAFDVRLCSLAARGLWIDMLGIMFKAEIRGTLTVNGTQVGSKTLANLTNSQSVKEMKSLLKELERNNVFSRLEDGTIYCRRVFKESSRKEELSRIRSKAGKKGSDKRWQRSSKENPENIAKIASSSSSPSSSPSSNAIASSKDIEKEFEEFWKFYRSIGNKKDDSGDKGEARKAYKTLRKTIEKTIIANSVHGYGDFLKRKRIDDNFTQRKMYGSTFLRSKRWERFKDFKYEPDL